MFTRRTYINNKSRWDLIFGSLKIQKKDKKHNKNIIMSPLNMIIHIKTGLILTVHMPELQKVFDIFVCKENMCNNYDHNAQKYISSNKHYTINSVDLNIYIINKLINIFKCL